jgi:hypothetical protein
VVGGKNSEVGEGARRKKSQKGRKWNALGGGNGRKIHEIEFSGV